MTCKSRPTNATTAATQLNRKVLPGEKPLPFTNITPTKPMDGNRVDHVPPTLLTPRPQAKVKDVAKILAKSTEKVRQLCHKGELEYTGGDEGFCIFLDSVAAHQQRELQKTKGRR